MPTISITRRKALAGLGVLAATTGLGFNTRPARAATTLRMWTFLDPVNGTTGREVALKALIENFEGANPGVTILVEPQNPRVMSEKFYAAHQTGTAPDVGWIITSRLHGAIRLGSLANLDELFLGNWSQEDLADVDAPSFRFGATDTAHYQLPNSAGMHAQLYRKDLFDEAGVDATSLTTWDKFTTELQKLVKTGANGSVERWAIGQPNAGLGPPSPILLSVLLQLQGKVFDDEGRATWATPAGITGMELQTDLIRKYKIMSEAYVNMSIDDVHEQFLADRIAVSRATTIRWQTAAKQFGAGKIGYLPTPSFTEGERSPAEMTGWHIGVWEGSQNKELAGKFVEYMAASKEADKVWTTVAGLVPNRSSTIADNPDFFADPNNVILREVAEDIRKIGWFSPEAAGAGGWSEALCGAFQDVIINNTEPMAALQKAEEVFNRTKRA